MKSVRRDTRESDCNVGGVGKSILVRVCVDTLRIDEEVCVWKVTIEGVYQILFTNGKWDLKTLWDININYLHKMYSIGQKTSVPVKDHELKNNKSLGGHQYIC